MMPTVYCVAPVEPDAVKVVLQVAVPVLMSPEFTKPTGRLLQPVNAVLVSRLMKVTLALRMSPALPSYAGSAVTAVMSRIVAESVTFALVLDANDVQNRLLPVYVGRASSFATTIVNEVETVVPVSSVTLTVTGYVPGPAVTVPVTFQIWLPGSVELPLDETSPSVRPAGSPTALVVRLAASVSGSVADTVTIRRERVTVLHRLATAGE